VVIEANGPFSHALKRGAVVEPTAVTGSVVTSSTGDISGKHGEVEDGVLHGGGIIEVERVNANLAVALTAVSTKVSSVTLAAHGSILVPQLVDVATIGTGELFGSLTDTVTRATGRVSGAGCTLASNTIISIKALASTGRSIADTLIGALHIVMRGVGQLAQVSVLHLRELLGSAIGVLERIVNDNSGIGLNHGSRSIKIALGGVYVG
jgi:hypothetical protein